MVGSGLADRRSPLTAGPRDVYLIILSKQLISAKLQPNSGRITEYFLSLVWWAEYFRTVQPDSTLAVTVRSPARSLARTSESVAELSGKRFLLIPLHTQTPSSERVQ